MDILVSCDIQSLYLVIKLYHEMCIEMYGWEQTLELPFKHTLKQVCMRWHQIEKEGWSLLSSKCAVVIYY